MAPAVPSNRSPSNTSIIMFSHPSRSYHELYHRNGLGPKFKSTIDNNRGLWSDLSLGRALRQIKAGEKRKEEETIELEGPLGKSDAVNKELVSIERDLAAVRKNGSIDLFGLYLYGLVLKAKGNENQARTVLVESVNAYPWNWSAWLELQSLCTTTDTLNSLKLNNHWMKDFFLASTYHELRMHNESLAKYEYLQATFDCSNYSG